MKFSQSLGLLSIAIFSEAAFLDELSPQTRAQLKRVDPVYPFFSVKHANQVLTTVGSFLGLVKPEPESTLYITSLMQANEVVQILFNANEDTDGAAAEAFLAAAEFWNEIIGETNLGTVTTGNTNPVQFCGLDVDDFPGAPTQFDTLVIAAQTVPIDGRGGTLAQAGPCATSGGFPRIGIMSFDEADAQNLLNQGQFQTVIEHEMGHVIGIGTLWAGANLVQNPCTSFNPCNTNPRYVGANALEGFEELGGSGRLDVANQGGSGTANAHWRESTFDDELMTGFLSSGDNPISIMTIKSLIDVGYTVDESKAESYQIPGIELPGNDDDNDVDENGDTPTSAPTYIIDMGEDTVNQGSGTNNDDNVLESVTDATGISGFLLGLGVAAVFVVLAVAVLVSRNRKERAKQASARWITNAKH